MSGRRRTGRGGFTLLEILLVVVIMGIASAVAVPAFSRSFRGAKLRASVRAVLTLHRNAQSKAVLGQRYMAILFDERKGTLEMVDQGQPGQKPDAFFGELGGPVAGAAADGGETPADEGVSMQSVLVRRLEEGVSILSFRGGQAVDDLYYVSYYPNGMCEAYEIEIGDEENRTARIRVDPVTGKAKVERD